MQPVSLGILDGIQKVLQWIFNEVFVPVLKDVFNIVFYMISDMLSDIFGELLLKARVALLKLINFIESIFSIFSGYTQIKVENVDSNQGILQYLFGLPVVQRAMLLVTAVSFVLAMLATGIAVIQSMGDSIAENKRPISTVLREALKTAVTFMMIPFACTFAIEMVCQILRVIGTALLISENQSLGDCIFYAIAQSHGKKKGYEAFASNNKFQDIAGVQKFFEYKKFDFLIAIIVSLFLMMILITTIMQFIQRLFMIVILYVVSPIFAAYMPLDGGKSFKQWKDAFVAFMISAFSPIVAMRLYMATLPLMLSSDMEIGSGIDKTLMKLLLVLGGSFAIYTSRNMLVKLYNPSLGEQLDANSFLVNMALGGIGDHIRQRLRNPTTKEKKDLKDDKKDEKK